LNCSSTRYGALIRTFATSKRDPARPKAPITPYFSFLADFRKSPESANVATAKGIVSEAAKKWKVLPESEKKPYNDKYAAEKAVFDTKFAEYKDSGALDAWKRDPSRPKKPLTGFLLYTQEFREKNLGNLDMKTVKVTEVTKKASESWKSMTPAQKAKYDDIYKAEKVKYDAAMKEYKESGKELAWKEKKGLLEQEEKTQKAKEKAAALKEKLKATREKAKAKKAAAKEKARVAKMQAAEKQRAALEKAKRASALKKAALREKEIQAREKLKQVQQRNKDILK